MKNYFSSIDAIIYGTNRPWIESNSIDEKYASLLTSIPTEKWQNQPRYNLQFERAFDHKTKYFKRFLENEKIRIISNLIEDIKDDNNKQLTKYRLNDTLNKKLKTRIKEIGVIIKQQQFDLSYINPRKTTFDIDHSHKANTYTVQLLKTTLIHIYLEVQTVFIELIQDELETDDFYTQLLYEPLPNSTYINEIITTEEESPKKAIKTIPTAIQSLHSFKYIDYNKSPEKLTDLWDALSLSGFIDKKEVPSQTFKRIFSGREISKPIVWNGNISDLYYFVKLLNLEYKFIEPLKNQVWKVTCKCFVQLDGSEFNWQQFRSLKTPKNTAPILEKAVKNLA